MRITLPTILEYDNQFVFAKLKYLVIRVYLSLTGIIVLEMLLIYLSVILIYMTTDWIAVLYLPLLIYAMHRTYATCVLYLARLISDKDAYLFLTEHWRRYFEHDDQFWIEIQTKLQCCGLESPRTYLMYSRQVHPTCYSHHHGEIELITRGCEDVVYDHFFAVQILAKGLSWLALGLQLLATVFYLGFVLHKYMYIIYPNMRRVRIYIY
ncbi:uncharacterized protein LOC116805312 isoform X1 [Drosophila grimshawi]|uniref:uncharacterized protein LOC116805312 isoform X1 n=1 Tax=Drosophila grimshawi TaxID=7222 RepID=UPI000C8703F2|nr:uncharacterized protein LOC116805312 isoform X1 [Drosophila grimshawi]XP_032592372.1 uncharacterized protein LOC116805312 isoform X1 [Drosophila grimshawi]